MREAESPIFSPLFFLHSSTDTRTLLPPYFAGKPIFFFSLSTWLRKARPFFPFSPSKMISRRASPLFLSFLQRPKGGLCQGKKKEKKKLHHYVIVFTEGSFSQL